MTTKNSGEKTAPAGTVPRRRVKTASKMNAKSETSAEGGWVSTEPPLQQQQYHHPYRKLYRSREDKWLGGVAGGFAKYFNVDPVIARLLWVIVILATCGAGIIGYILFWLFVEKEPEHYLLDREYVTEDEYHREHHHYHYKTIQ